MIAPAKRFQESPHGKGWLDVVDTQQFQEAASAALLQMTLNNSSPPDMATSASYQWRMEGAKQFLGILMSLTEAAPARQPYIAPNLDHKL